MEAETITMNVKVDGAELDGAVGRAEKLVRLLERAQELQDALGVSGPKDQQT